MRLPPTVRRHNISNCRAWCCKSRCEKAPNSTTDWQAIKERKLSFLWRVTAYISGRYIPSMYIGLVGYCSLGFRCIPMLLCDIGHRVATASSLLPCAEEMYTYDNIEDSLLCSIVMPLSCCSLCGVGSVQVSGYYQSMNAEYKKDTVQFQFVCGTRLSSGGRLMNCCWIRSPWEWNQYGTEVCHFKRHCFQTYRVHIESESVLFCESCFMKLNCKGQ